MKHVEIKFQTKNDESEMLIALLDDLGFEGFEENENQLSAFIKETLFQKELLDETIAPLNISYAVNYIEEQNWNAEWEANLQPVSIDQVYLHAYFQKPDTSFRYNICITPKMSFGTGHHPTTRLMCQIGRAHV